MSKPASDMTDEQWDALIAQAGPEQALSVKILRVIVKPLEDLFAAEVLGKASIGDWLRALIKADAVMIAQSLHHFVPDDPRSAEESLTFVCRVFTQEVHDAFIRNCKDPNGVIDAMLTSADVPLSDVKVFTGSLTEVMALLEGLSHDKH